MAAILIFCHICQKRIFFTFSFVIYLSLTVYFSKYLQFRLNSLMHCQNHVNQHVFVDDNSPRKCNFFFFGKFFFLSLDNFSEKTYEKTCHFYNIFSKSISICARLKSIFKVHIVLSTLRNLCHQKIIFQKLATLSKC